MKQDQKNEKSVATAAKNLPQTATEGQYEIMTMEKNEIGLILKENLGESALTVDDLPRIKVPSGGGTTWSVPTLRGDEEMKELTGVIIFTQTIRTYWEEDYDTSGGGAPPDCYSPDAQYGVGIWADKVKDRACGNCPMSEFAKDGTGCPCKESRLIFMVTQEEILPISIKAPVMSLPNAKQYLTALTSRRKKIHSVYTTLTLESDKNARNQKYSKIVFRKTGDVEAPDVTAAYAANIRPYLEKRATRMATAAMTEPEE